MDARNFCSSQTKIKYCYVFYSILVSYLLNSLLVPPLFNEYGCTELLFLTNKNKILLRVLLNSCVVPPQFLTCAPSVQWIWMHGTFVPLIKNLFLVLLLLVLWSNALNTGPRLPTRLLPGLFPNPDLRLLSSSQHVTWSWRHFDFVCCN